MCLASKLFNNNSRLKNINCSGFAILTPSRCNKSSHSPGLTIGSRCPI